MISKLKFSPFISQRIDEAISRTVLELILLDRLNGLESQDVFERLIMSAEVQINTKATEHGTPLLIRGRADWVLGWGDTTANTGTLLVAIEAKARNNGSGMGQLVAYLAGIHDVRKTKTHLNSTVFGVLSDGDIFTFACLDNDKKLSISPPFHWRHSQQTILAFLDELLQDAIHSSPHTTPVKSGNATLLGYGRYLKEKWSFGESGNDEHDSDKEDTEVIVDVVKKQNGRIVLVSRPVPKDSELST